MRVIITDFGHQHDATVFPHGLGQFRIQRGIIGVLEMHIEHDEAGAVRGQLLQQLSVKRAIPEASRFWPSFS